MSRFVLFLPLVILLGVTSCHTLPENAPEKAAGTTARKTLPPDAVTVDILLIQVPYHERDLIRQLWRDVDEQEMDREERFRLNENGFRMGIIGATLPESLSTLLTLKGRPLRTSLEEEIELNQNEGAPAVASKSLTLRAGIRSEIDLWGNDIVANIPVLKNEGGTLVGKSYSDARTLLTVSIRQKPDGSVQFELVPLLRYGVPEKVTRYQYAQLVTTQEQPTKTFEQIRSRIDLRPGQFLVMGVSDESTNGLGRYFFTRGTEDLRQKLLVVRLLVTQHDGQFDRFPGFAELLKETDPGAGKSRMSESEAKSIPQ